MNQIHYSVDHDFRNSIKLIWHFYDFSTTYYEVYKFTSTVIRKPLNKKRGRRPLLAQQKRGPGGEHGPHGATAQPDGRLRGPGGWHQMASGRPSKALAPGPGQASTALQAGPRAAQARPRRDGRPLAGPATRTRGPARGDRVRHIREMATNFP